MKSKQVRVWLDTYEKLEKLADLNRLYIVQQIDQLVTREYKYVFGDTLPQKEEEPVAGTA